MSRRPGRYVARAAPGRWPRGRKKSPPDALAGRPADLCSRAGGGAAAPSHLWG